MSEIDKPYAIIQFKDMSFDLIHSSWLVDKGNVMYPTDLQGRAITDLVNEATSPEDSIYKFKSYKIINICCSGSKIQKMEQKLIKFIESGGNFTSTGTESDYETPTRLIKPRSDTFKCESLLLNLVQMSKDLKAQLSSLEIKAFNQFDNLTNRLNGIEEKLRNPQNGFNGGSTAEKILNGNPVWKTLEEFNEFDIKLMNDKEFKVTFVKELSAIGGCSPQSCTSNIIKRCFDADVLNLFTLKGCTKSKLNFSSTCFYQVLIDVVKDGYSVKTEDVNGFLKHLIKNYKKNM